MNVYRVPKFHKSTGYLLPGVYQMTIDELLNHKILGGTLQRQNLILSLKEACETYWQYGISEIYTNGSFSTMKAEPNDIDGYICIDTNSQGFKDLINSGSIWSKFYGYHHPKDKFQMWYEHRIEFYIESEHEKIFQKFFTHSRENIVRGIIKVVK